MLGGRNLSCSKGSYISGNSRPSSSSRKYRGRWRVWTLCHQKNCTKPPSLLSCMEGDQDITSSGGWPLGGLIEDVKAEGESCVLFLACAVIARWTTSHMYILFAASWCGGRKSESPKNWVRLFCMVVVLAYWFSTSRKHSVGICDRLIYII